MIFYIYTFYKIHMWSHMINHTHTHHTTSRQVICPSWVSQPWESVVNLYIVGHQYHLPSLQITTHIHWGEEMRMDRSWFSVGVRLRWGDSFHYPSICPHFGKATERERERGHAQPVCNSGWFFVCMNLVDTKVMKHTRDNRLFFYLFFYFRCTECNIWFSVVIF